MKAYYGRNEPEYKDLLACFCDCHFAKTSQSTIPQMAFWRDASSRILEIGKDLGIKSTTWDICFEYPCVACEGQASYTDVMCIAEEAVVGVECKMDEKLGENIQSWLARGKDLELRRRILANWKGMLRNYCENVDDLSEHPYEFLHRAASVVSIKKFHSAMIFQIFLEQDKNNDNEFENVIKHFVKSLKPRWYFKIYLQRVWVKPTVDFKRLEKSIESLKIKEKSALIRDFLVNEKLYNFSPELPEWISA